jgi:hypothetical protein
MVETPHTKSKPAANVRPTGKRRMPHDGLSQAPCSQKCRQHGLTYLPTGWTTRIKDRRTREAGTSRLTHGFNVQGLASTTSQLLKIAAPLLMFLSEGVMLYSVETMVETPINETLWCDLW